MVKADALGRLGFAGERRRLLRYVSAVHGDSRFAADARAALEAMPETGDDGESSGAILPAVVVVDRPWLRRPVEVFYPLEASLAELEGSVHLVLEVDRAGEVVDHRVLAASDPAFARAVEGAVRDFSVDPDALRGRGSRRTKRVLLDFRLRQPDGVTRDAPSP
jgi:TonB family protein